MALKNPAATLIAIVEAFHTQRTWIQSELARHVGIEVRTVRAHLELLQKTGRFPLERVVDGQQVYWSLPRAWVPGGVSIGNEDIAPLVRALARAPRNAFGMRMIASLVASAPPKVRPTLDLKVIDPPLRGDFEERMLAHLEDAASRGVALGIRYYTASRGEETRRVVSVQHIDTGTPARFLAHCHTAKELRTFRVDGLRGAVVEPSVAFVRVDPDHLERVLATRVDGFLGKIEHVATHAFHVDDPESLWVENNLLSPMKATRREGGIDVLVTTAAVEPLARFVVGLGASARATTPELRERVKRLAEGALSRCGDES